MKSVINSASFFSFWKKGLNLLNNCNSDEEYIFEKLSESQPIS